jgi:hypothetical protein
VFTCEAENGVQCFGKTDDAHCCLAFPADLSERRRQNEVRSSKCALEWYCRALPRAILRSKMFVFGVFATASWRW